MTLLSRWFTVNAITNVFRYQLLAEVVTREVVLLFLCCYFLGFRRKLCVNTLILLQLLFGEDFGGISSVILYVLLNCNIRFS